MSKPPIGDEEQDGIYLPKQRRSQRPAQQTYVQARKGSAVSASADRYHSDEHPNVPKIRRASRFTEEELPVITHKLPEVEEPLEEELPEEDIAHSPMRREGTGKVPVTSPRRRPYEPLPKARPAASKSQSVRQRPVRPYENTRPQHPTAARRSREQYSRYGRREKHHSTRSLLATLQDFSHNRTLVTISVGVLLALVFVPILVNVTLNSMHNSTSSGIITGTGQGTNSGSGNLQSVGQQPIDPHELVITPPETDHPAPPVFATSAYLLDADTGATLYASNPFMHLPMMSTTKLMTATLVIERGNLDQRVTINDQIARDLGTLSADSSLMGIKKGETYTLRELMYGLMLVSGNDAAIAIGNTLGGNLPNFVNMMNDKARSLGLLDTHYMNPHGLLATSHYSSAHDLAILGRYAFNLPKLREIDGTRTFDIAQNGNHAAHHMFNGNQFLWWYPGVDGGKPGWDGGSNFVQVVSCTRNGHHLIGVAMHTVNWWTDMRNLMNWGFNTFTWVSPHDVDARSPIPYDNLWNYFTNDRQDATVPTPSGRYYVYTGYSVSQPIVDYFDANGGLKKFGYPIGLLTAGTGSTVSQRFEHSTIACDTSSKQCSTA